MMDEPGIPLAHTDWVGWPWHGMLRYAPAFGHSLQLPDGRVIESGAPVSANPLDGNWNLTLGDGDTYLWDLGLPGLPDPEIESKGGAWWGKAILRQGTGYAYGALYMATGLGSTPNWPVSFDGQVGRAALLLVSDTQVLIDWWPDTTLGAEVAKLSLELPGVDMGQDGPPVRGDSGYINRLRFTLHDITPDGRSALIMIEGEITPPPVTPYIRPRLGLLRIDIGGTAEQPQFAVSVVESRAQAVGQLINETVGSLTPEALMPDPVRLTQDGGQPPSCSDRVSRADGVLVKAEAGATTVFRGNLGTTTRTVGQRGQLAAAWFGPGGGVQIARLDSEIEEHCSNSRSDRSSGSYEARTTFSSDGQTCTQTSYVETDTRVLAVHGQVDYHLRQRLRLYTPDGTLLTTMSTEYRYSSQGDWSDENIGVSGGTQRDYLLDGELVYQLMEDEVMPALWGLSPTAADPFGQLLGVSWPEHRAEAINHVLAGPANLYTLGAIRHLTATNKVSLLGKLHVLANGDYEMTSGPLLTPAGATVGTLTGRISPRPGFGQLWDHSDTLSFYAASYNPVTHAVARAWPDFTGVSWV